MTKKMHLKNHDVRKRYWFINTCISIVLRFSFLFREKNLWVFGAWEGERFDDNSRYLYEYIIENKKDINAVWITKNEKVMEELSKKNWPVLLCDSHKGRKVMLRAGAAFYTNGLDDFSKICYLYGATIVHLGHAAAAIKKTGIYVNQYPNFACKKYLKALKDALFSWYYFTYVIATSEESANSKMKTYGVPRGKVIITGMPRNDVLLHYNVDKRYVIKHKDADVYRYILYLPTYRLYNNSVVEELMESLNADEMFLELLKKKKYKLLIKRHNADLSQCDFCGKNDFVKFLKSDDISSTQELLAITDILITDYSSCMIDFALTMRPVILYAPDYVQYNFDNGIIEDWDVVYKSEAVLKSPSSLKKELSKLLTTKNNNLDFNTMINDLYQDKTIEETVFSKNVCECICKKLGI